MPRRSRNNSPPDRDAPFVKLPKVVLQRRDLPATVKLVYAAILDRMNDNGMAWPGFRRIGKDAGCDRGTVQRSVRRLADEGLLLVESRENGRSNTYQRPQNSDGMASEASAEYGRSRRKTVRKTQPAAKSNRPKNATTGVRKMRTVPSAKCGHNETDSLNETQLQCAQGKPPRIPDPVWDAVCTLFGLKPVTDSDRKRVGKIARDLKAKGATPTEIQTRLDRYRHEWPTAADTPEALVKHWDRFGEDRPARGHSAARYHGGPQGSLSEAVRKAGRYHEQEQTR